EFRAQYGEDCFNDVIVNNNLIEIEELISDIIDMDGRGHIISGYDGMEHEVCIDGETLYIYRTN
ncbi:MAG: hypothetical protein ACRC7S_01165, partial [Cetobacterium sp.]